MTGLIEERQRREVELINRHAGEYKPLFDVEGNRLPYELCLDKKQPEYFYNLDHYDFLYVDNTGSQERLSKRGLFAACNHYFENTLRGSNYTENFFAKTFSKTILLITGKRWQSYLCCEANQDAPYHNDILRSAYLLFQLQLACESGLRLLTTANHPGLAEMQLYYPREDRHSSRLFSAYLSEMFVKILYHQPKVIRGTLKNLDLIKNGLRLFQEHPPVAQLLAKRSEDRDPPSWKILKHFQLQISGYHEAQCKDVLDKACGALTAKKKPGRRREGLCRSGAEVIWKWYIRCQLQRISRLLSSKELVEWHVFINNQRIKDKIFNALLADSVNKVQVSNTIILEKNKDNSIWNSIRLLLAQNKEIPISVPGRVAAMSVACIPESHLKYFELRAGYVVADLKGHTSDSYKSSINNPKNAAVDEYLLGNNIAAIAADIAELEKTVDYKIVPLPSADGFPTRYPKASLQMTSSDR